MESLSANQDDQDDRFERLAARLDAEPEKWTHEPGDRLLGEVVDIDEYVSDRGYEPSPMVTVEIVAVSTEENGKPIAPGEQRVFYVSRTTARSEWEKAKPAIGDEIGIKYFGIREGKDYHLYRIRNLSSKKAAAPEGGDAAGEPDPQAVAQYEERAAESELVDNDVLAAAARSQDDDIPF